MRNFQPSHIFSYQRLIDWLLDSFTLILMNRPSQIFSCKVILVKLSTNIISILWPPGTFLYLTFISIVGWILILEFNWWSFLALAKLWNLIFLRWFIRHPFTFPKATKRFHFFHCFNIGCDFPVPQLPSNLSTFIILLTNVH